MNSLHYFTRYDMHRLKEMLKTWGASSNRNNEHIRDLGEKLKSGVIVEPENIPRDTITMNSRFVLKDLDSRKTVVYSLVFPRDADVTENRISILAPIGTALLGKMAGEVVSWKVPVGIRRLKIVDVVYQPEANGDYLL